MTAILVACATTWGYFIMAGTGSSSATIGALAASSITSTTAGAGTMTLVWSSVASPTGSGTVSYYVTRDGGNPAGNCPTSSSPTTVTTCTDSGLAVGTHTYTVTSVWNSWSTASATASPTVAYGALDHFNVTASSTATAGTPFSVTVTAEDVNNNTVANYLGTVHFTSTDGQAVLPSDYTFVAGDSGSHTFTNGVTLKTAGSKSVSVKDTVQTSVTGSATVIVSAASASSLTLGPATTTPTAGAADNLTITALDPYGNTATGYTGSKNLTFGGASTIGSHTPTVTSSLGTATNFGTPTSISFTNGVATVTGSNNGAMTLYKVQSANITVTDGSVNNGAGTAVTVGPGAASTFTVPTPATQTAGTAFNVTLTAYDAYGNLATGYSGSQTISFSGPSNSPDGTAPSYPGSVSFSSGTGTASITLYKAASTTLTATQGSVTGSTGAFTVGAGPNAKIATSAGATQTAGTSFSVTLTAQDSWGNVPGTLSSTKTISMSGPNNSPNNTAPTLPTSATFSAGTATVSGVKLVDAETTTLTVADSTDSYPGIASSNITVNPTTFSKIGASAGTTQTAGTAFTLTLTAEDTYGNTTNTTASKTIRVTGPSNSPNANTPTLPTSASFSAGIATPSVTLVDAQTVALSVNDTTDGFSATTASITVDAGAVNRLKFTSTAVHGASAANANLGPVTVAETDAYGNTTTTAETVNLSSSSAGKSFGSAQFGTGLSSVSIPSGSSSASFWYGDSNTGSPVLTAAATGLTSGTQTETITTAPAGLAITNYSSGPTYSGCYSITVRATYTCSVTGVGTNGSVKFEVMFATSADAATTYSTTQSSTLSATVVTGGGTISPSSQTIAENGTTTGSQFTATISGTTTSTYHIAFGPYTLTVSVAK